MAQQTVTGESSELFNRQTCLKYVLRTRLDEQRSALVCEILDN